MQGARGMTIFVLRLSCLSLVKYGCCCDVLNRKDSINSS